jgi:flavin-dependent dehydrogenase
VPGRRLNVGIVLSGRDRLRALATRGAADVGAEILAAALHGDRQDGTGAIPAMIDSIAGASPLGHRVARRAGIGWLLVGDAAGFLDPFTGEGVHRALVSARLAADAIDRARVDRDLSEYHRAMRRRFAAKDVVSMVVQAFLAQPLLFEYAARRLAGRPQARDIMGMVMGDLTPARRALDPRFLAALLAP